MNFRSEHTASELSRFSGREKTNAVLRLLKGESLDQICEELGVSARRLERWKDDFVSAGAAELGRRKDIFKPGLLSGHLHAIQQWTLFLIVLVIVISAIVYLQNRPTP